MLIVITSSKPEMLYAMQKNSCRSDEAMNMCETLNFYTCNPFSSDLSPMVSYLIAVLIHSIACVEYYAGHAVLQVC